jgi:hypothetical protein
MVAITCRPSWRPAHKRFLDFHDVVLIETMHFDDGAGRIRAVAPEFRLHQFTTGRKRNMSVTNTTRRTASCSDAPSDSAMSFMFRKACRSELHDRE